MPNIVASIRPGTNPAMKSWPTEAESTMAPSGPLGCMPLVATAKMTRLIDGGRDRRARDRGKQRAGNDAGEPKPAIPMPDHRGCKIDHAPRHPAGGEEIAGQDEKRDRHDLEAVDAGE